MIQIPEDVFRLLVRSYLLDDKSRDADIALYLEGKLESIVRRELYTKYKCAPTEEAREEARKAYLDAAGIKQDWRA